MRPDLSILAALAMAGVASARGLVGDHTSKLLHVSPPISEGKVEMFPSRHPDHDGLDMDHLVPQHGRRIYFAQEGHRSHIHGSKHAQLNATFTHPAVVLDHSDHLTSVSCTKDSMEVCFENLKARRLVEKAWKENTRDGKFHILTYHRGCGDLSGTRRSYFLASQPVRNAGFSCVSMHVVPVAERDALESGEIQVGKFERPVEKRESWPLNSKRQDDPKAGGDSPDSGTDSPGGGDKSDEGKTVDLEKDTNALDHFFNTTVDANAPVPEEHPNFIDPDGTVPPTNGSTSSNGTAMLRRRLSEGRPGTSGLAKRDFASFTGSIYDGFKKLVKKVDEVIGKGVDYVVDGLKTFAAKTVTSFLATVFKDGITLPYHRNYPLDKFLEPKDEKNTVEIYDKKSYLLYEYPTKKDKGKGKGDKPKMLLARADGDGKPADDKGKGKGKDGKGKKKLDVGVKLACVKCGVEGNFAVDALFRFDSKTESIDGYLIIDSTQDLKAYAHLGIEVSGKYPLLKEKKQIAAIPVSPLTVPGLFTLGPEITFSASLNIDLEGEIEVVVGGTVSLSKGKAMLYFNDKDKSGITGFEPGFEPIAKARGHLSIKAALGLPVGFEVGADILNGKYKATVGLIDTPSFFISATASSGEGKACDNGVEIRLGAKNKLEIDAFKIFNKPISDVSLIDYGLGCVDANGFSQDKVKNTTGVLADVAKDLGGEDKLEVSQPNNVMDLAAKISSEEKNQRKFWSIISDKGSAEQPSSSLLVSGKNGNIYLAKPDENTELTEPWGTTDPDSASYMFDSLGRIISFDGLLFQLDSPNGPGGPGGSKVVALTVHDAKAMPAENEGALISLLTKGDSKGSYGIYLAGFEIMYFPTFCKTDMGLQLFATEFVVGEGGKVYDKQGKETDAADASFKDAKVNKADCQTIELISSGFTQSLS